MSLLLELTFNQSNFGLFTFTLLQIPVIQNIDLKISDGHLTNLKLLLFYRLTAQFGACSKPFRLLLLCSKFCFRIENRERVNAV